jgi:hypothetical protein
VIARHAHLFASRSNNTNHTTQFLETHCLGRALHAQNAKHNTTQHNTLYFAARLASAVASSLSRGTAAPWFNSKARFLYHISLLHLGSLFSLAWPLSNPSKPIHSMLSLTLLSYIIMILYGMVLGVLHTVVGTHSSAVTDSEPCLSHCVSVSLLVRGREI